MFVKKNKKLCYVTVPTTISWKYYVIGTVPTYMLLNILTFN